MLCSILSCGFEDLLQCIVLEVADEGDFIEDFVGCSCVDMVAFVGNVVGVGTCSRVARLVWIPHRYVCNMGDVDPIFFGKLSKCSWP